MNRLKQIMARLGRFTATGFASKLLTVRDLLSLAFHSALAAIVIFGGFWADFLDWSVPGSRPVLDDRSTSGSVLMTKPTGKTRSTLAVVLAALLTGIGGFKAGDWYGSLDGPLTPKGAYKLLSAISSATDTAIIRQYRQDQAELAAEAQRRREALGERPSAPGSHSEGCPGG